MAEHDDTVAQIQQLHEEAAIKDSMILELSEALKEANFKVAQLNGQKKLRDMTIHQLRKHLATQPTA